MAEASTAKQESLFPNYPAPTTTPARATSGGVSGSRLFDAIKELLEARQDLTGELHLSLERALRRFSPTYRANRHLIGGIVERVLAAVVTAAGIPIHVHGDDANGYDISIDETHPDYDPAQHAQYLGEQISIKSSFSKISHFTISNGMGGEGAGLTHDTIFISPELGGVVYVNPQVHTDVASSVTSHKDSKHLSKAVIQSHRYAHPETHIPMKLPVNHGEAGDDISLIVLHALLEDGACPNIRKVLGF